MRNTWTRMLALALCLMTAAFAVPAEAEDLASVRVHVYYDSNNNGELGPYERSVPDAEVSVVTLAGETVAGAVMTNRDGDAVLTEIPAGTYAVRVVLPANYGYGKMGTKGKDGSSSVMDESLEAEQVSQPIELLPGKRQEVGVGALRLAAISGKVWLDENDDGIMQEDEPGCAGAKIELIGEKNGLTYEFVTGEDGLYRMAQVTPGLYKLRVTAPDGMMFAKYSKKGGVNRSFFTNAGKRVDARQVKLVGGEELTDRNVGLAEDGVLHVVCFLDANYNGVMDEGEAPLPGVTCEAIKANGKTAASAVSDENGVATLSALRSGSYRIRALLPKGHAFTLVNEQGNRFAAREGRRENTLTDIAVTTGEVRTLSVGAVIPGSISGVAYLDDDFSADRNGKEKTVSGLTVVLYDAQGRQVATERTGNKGGYAFEGLNPGDYQVRTTAKSGYAFTKLGEGNLFVNTGDGTGETEKLHLALGQDMTGVDMGMIRPGVVQGAVFADSNDNGVQDADESGLAGTVVRLMEETGEAFSATVGEDGLFRFDAVMPGRYYLRYELPERGVLAKKSAQGNQVDGQDGVGASQWFDFKTGAEVEAPLCGGLILGEIRAAAFADHNGSGVMDADEAPLAGVTLTLTPSRSDLEAIQVTSGADGVLAIGGLHPDTYTAVVSCPDGYILSRMDESTLPFVPGFPQAVKLDVPMGGSWVNQPLGCVKPAAIRGTAWLDENNDGFRGENEAAPAGTVVAIIDQQTGETFAEMVIDENGAFAAEGMIPGLYTLRYASVTPKAGDCTFTPADASVMEMRDVRLTEGSEATGMTAAVVLYATLSGRAWVDLGGEVAALPGVQVALLDESGSQLRSAVTDESGAYAFTELLPGVYTVRADLPEGHVAVEPGDSRLADGSRISVMAVCQGRSAQSAPIQVRMGVEAAQLDIGAVLPGSLGDICWLDENGNGLQDSGEPGLAGVKIVLTRGGRVVAETETNAYGYYRLMDVYPAEYLLRVTAPEGVVATKQRTDFPGIASVLAEDMTAVITVESDKNNRNADLGFVLVKPGVYPAGYGDAPTQDWTKPNFDEE